MQTHRLRTVCILVMLVFCSLPSSAQNTQGTLSGQIFDQLGGLIPNATIEIVDPRGLKKTVTSDAKGSYSIPNLEIGKYNVRVVAPGFAAYENAEVEIKAGRQQLDIKLNATIEEQRVSVTTEKTVGTESENNADQLVLRDKELDMLPDDPEGLVAALQALAGPAAGPEGGQIFVDGFSGGRIPTKQSIREVRINQNTISAEFDRVGFGRIEILTRAGTDKFRGQTYFNFSDESLNSRNPFSLTRGPYQSRQYGGSLSGPIKAKKLSVFADLERREIDDNAVINATVLDSNLNVSPFRAVVLAPFRGFTASTRFDYQLSPDHTLVARYFFARANSNNNGIGELSLASRGFDTESTDHTFQLTETSVLNPSTVNETRFQFVSSSRNQIDQNASPALIVLDAFNGGGAQIGPAFYDEKRFELHNYTTVGGGAHTWRFGGRLRFVDVDDDAPANFGGTYTFAGGLAPRLDSNNQILVDSTGAPVIDSITSIERYRRTLLFQQHGLTPPEIRLLGGGATQFSMVSGDPLAGVDRWDFGGFVQDDWRVRTNLTLNLGLRYETQTNISSHLNFAPRLGFAWAPNRGPRPKTIVRGAFGIFYNRFGENLTLQAERFNGITQRQFIVTAQTPQGRQVLDLFPNIPSNAILESTADDTQTMRRIAEDLQSMYSMQYAVSVERQLPHGLVLSGSFTHARTLHVLRSRNINAPLPGTDMRPLGDLGNIYVYEGSGIFKQTQLIFAGAYRRLPRVVLSGSYSYNKASGDTDGAATFPVNQFDLSGEFGRGAIDIRHRFFLGGTVTAPWGIDLNPFIIALSGQPFNIITGRDANGDTLFTERPAFATSLGGADVINTGLGAFVINPAPGQPLIPRNFGDGPAYFNVNLRITKAFAFGDLPGTVAATQGSAGNGSRPSEKRYRLSLSLQIQNLFNRTNAGAPIGNLSSPLFGQSISSNSGLRVSGGISGNNSAAANRRLEMQIRFSF